MTSTRGLRASLDMYFDEQRQTVSTDEFIDRDGIYFRLKPECGPSPESAFRLDCLVRQRDCLDTAPSAAGDLVSSPASQPKSGFG
jgi:hypothetical protein